jgi:DNA polymerase III subunit delta'
MLWNDFLGHEEVRERFRRAVAQGRLGGTYLLVGPSGVGKRRFALKLAQALLCQEIPESELEACGTCRNCQQAIAGSHPDLQYVHCPEDKANIPIETFIGPRENRLREGFCYEISLKSYAGGRKVGIIDDADTINQEGANCLLKMLEEPPPGAVIFLLATSLQKQLPTIRSRSQVVQFSPLTPSQVAQILTDQQLIDDPGIIQAMAELSEGSLDRAIEMADPELLEYRTEFLQCLAAHDWDALDLAKRTSKFVEQAGTEAPARRRRLRQLIHIATTFYRQQLRALHGLDPLADPGASQAVGQAIRHPEVDTSAITDCIDRCVTAEYQLAANANVATLIECWLDELSCLTYGYGRKLGR